MKIMGCAAWQTKSQAGTKKPEGNKTTKRQPQLPPASQLKKQQ